MKLGVVPGRGNIKVRDCFWWKKGKCGSPEISRFRHDEGNDTCLYDADAAAVVDEYVKRGMDPLRCHEFRFKGGEPEKMRSKAKNENLEEGWRNCREF